MRTQARPGALLLLAMLAGAAQAQTVTVTTVADAIDIDPFAGTVADLPGPDGLVSFSEAMIATNNTPGHQTVAFAIPAGELGWCCPQYDGIAVFHSISGFYWRANDAVTIDGTTQTAFAGDTNPDGAEVLLYGATFYLNDDASTLRGFHGTAVQSGGAGSLIADNTGGMNLTLFGGGGTTVRDNSCGTIKIDRSNDNVVVANTASRVRVLGGGTSSPATGNRIGGPTLAERNFIVGYGTHNSEGLPSGAAVQLAWTVDTLIENNRIGTTPDGLAQGNLACTMGIDLETENHGVTVRDNQIAGILGHGMGPHHAGQLFGWAVYFWGTVTDVELAGNTIGLDANGAPTLGSVWGVNVDNFSGYSQDDVRLIDNVIAGHILDGVRVGPTATMRLSGNSIHDNGWLGVDLIPTSFESGVSPNDPLDLDEGGSGVQNFPELALATPLAGGVLVTGALHSSPSDAFTLEFFASPACDPSGHGQGQVPLGTTAVETDAAGDISFSALLPTPAPAGWMVTATATLEPEGATSELSACVPLGGALGTVFCVGDGSAAACPCGNESGAGEGAGCTTSSGAGALLRGAGSSSVAADDLLLVTAGMPTNQAGVLFMGPGQVAPALFGDGLRCVSSPFYRYPVRPTGTTGSFTHGPGLVAWSQSHFPAPARIQPGDTWHFQSWFRDPHGSCGFGTNLSNGLEIEFTP
jgi:hypothetical protein